MTGVDGRRAAGGVALVLLILLLLIDGGKLLATAVHAIGYPYDLDYGEGIVWQQMTNIVAGQGYAPLGTFPAIVYHYPPVYHLVVAAAATMTGADELAAGRTISLLATLAAMVMVGWLAARTAGADGRAATLVGGMVAALAFGASPTVIFWAPLMRVDILATALTLGGLCFVVRGLRTPERLPIGAAVLFALAVYTKQTAIFGPLAAFVALWLTQRRQAWQLALLCGGLGAVALIGLMLASHGQFLRHVVSYNVNRFDPGRWHLLARVLASQAVLLAIAVTAIATMRSSLARSPARLLLAIYFGLRVATLPLALKSGASDNYLIDLFSVAAVFVGIAASEIAAAVIAGKAWPRALVTLLVLVGLPVQAARVQRAHTDVIGDPVWRAEAAAVVARIRAEPKPVLGDYMVLLRRAGRPVLFEPAIIAELTHSGLYDERAVTALVRRHAFGFVLSEGDGAVYAERYSPALRAAIAAAYPRLERHGAMVLHLAPGPISRAGPAPAPPPPAAR